MSQSSSNNNTSRDILSLKKLSRIVKNTLSEGFPEEFWVVAEISEFHLNTSGHAYLDLIEKDPDTNRIQARMRATIWSYTFRMLRPYFEASTGYQLSSGIKVLVYVSLEYHPLYSISLNIKDIDPSYTLGDLARKKAEIIEKLKQEGVFEMNRQLSLPDVPQKIAVISSETAAGFGDFINSLSNNNYQFHFEITLFSAIMQGDRAEESIIAAMDQIYDAEKDFDLVVIIRGGGAQIELECFNNYDLAYYITQFPLPIITGIGHERDETVADMVACKKLKTPTAVAEFLIGTLSDFLNIIKEYEKYLHEHVKQRLLGEKDRLSIYTGNLALYARQNLSEASAVLNNAGYRIKSGTQHSIKEASAKLNELKIHLSYRVSDHLSGNLQHCKQLELFLKKKVDYLLTIQNEKLEALSREIKLYKPENILSRGYSITMFNGKILKDPSGLKTNDEIITVLHKGNIKSKVK